MTSALVPLATGPILADASKDGGLSQVIDHASVQSANWWLAGISVIALLVLGWVGRWLVKGYSDLQSRSYEKEKEYAEREEKYRGLLKEMGDQLAVVNREATNKLHEVTVKVAEVVTRNSDALDHNSEQSKELIKVIDKMERSIDSVGDQVSQAKDVMHQQREILMRERENTRRKAPNS